MDSSRELSVKHSRRRPVRGGTTICGRCDALRVPGSAYCAAHRNAYQRQWRRGRTALLKKLLAEREKSLCEFPEDQ